MSSNGTLKVAVLDMQPIMPAVGGGRLRLLGLYHALSLPTLYVGTYDWPGPGYRRQMLSPTLEELLVPLSAEHFAAAQARALATSGRVVIDSTFPELAALSPDYVAAARDAAAGADAVIFSHPWIYPLVREVLDPARQLIVYDSHNVEGALRMELLDDGGPGTDIVRDVIRVELELCRSAHLILTCSHEDRAAFHRLFGVPYDRMRVFPNGTFTSKLTPATPEQKSSARDELGLGSSSVAFFIGSNYAPNVQAAQFIAHTLAPSLPHVLFVVAGSVSESLTNSRKSFNLRVLGLLEEERKLLWLRACDIAINPMFAGSGTNIKMLDYMSAGLPIVTTPTGARGIETSKEVFILANPPEFANAIDMLLPNGERSAVLSQSAREQAQLFYSWERLSQEAGALISHQFYKVREPQPFFSVVVPTYNRHSSLTTLLDRLTQQMWHDFEVIIVDQSDHIWPESSRKWPFDLYYIHTDVRGAVTARNTGVKFARGKIIAFVDDDCEPCNEWLAAASGEFNDDNIVGLEGLIESDHLDDANWRPVTNAGFEGIGFLTANLFIRASTFQAINGFDIRFDNPHFREDTDLGWRAQSHGRIPFSRSAKVYHPAQPRALERESLSARARFFEKDALLLHKHPQKYVDLMRRERQWLYNPEFWKYFLLGVKRYKVSLPAEIRGLVPGSKYPELMG